MRRGPRRDDRSVRAYLESFLAALRDAGVTFVIDVRQRRGVRGREYAWANAQRLQAALAAAGKRSRRAVAPAYVEDYLREILDPADLDDVLPENGLASLLGVERDPEACHRSLVVAALAGGDVLHLKP